MKRIAGLDQLRFVLALWVLLAHCKFIPDLSGRPYTSLLDLGFRAFANNFINPVAAVIVFFVISGFCIHLPYRIKPKVELAPYFTRRFVRILIPMAAAFLLTVPLKVKFPLFTYPILWSLVCEEIYYLVYPALRMAAARIGWKKLFLIAFMIALVLALTTLNKYESTRGGYPALGPQLTWLLGLPCWLLGCVLAEGIDSVKTMAVTSRQIWIWRFGIWTASWGCSVLKFHSPIGYPLTLNLFAILAFCWLQREIAYYQTRQPMRFLEKAGSWSYSTYLMHIHAQAVYLLLGFPVLVMPLSWITHLTFLLGGCYLFYLVVERPSHRLARHLSRQLSNHLHKPALQEATYVTENGSDKQNGELTLVPIATESLQPKLYWNASLTPDKSKST